jgi:Uma2 family endonuclease
MATVREVKYPTSDGRPMAETDTHRDDMLDLIETLKERFAAEPGVYVSGNLLLYYVPGDQRKHVSPDVFVVRGVGMRQREYYLLWEEGKGPDVVIELTSSSTRVEDTKRKFALYQDVLKVPEYFLFDPRVDYLEPPLVGYRLQRGKYVPISRVKDRLPSKVLGLHLERSGRELRLYDPEAGRWLGTPRERTTGAELRAAQAELRTAQAEARAALAEARAAQAEALLARQQAEIELERLRKQTPPYS